MVSLRCKMIVKQELENLGLKYGTIDLGEVDVLEAFEKKSFEKLQVALLKYGLELMDSKKAIMIERIKGMVIEMVYYTDEFPLLKNSEMLSDKLGQNYTHLATLFSEATGITIEKYIIAHKIEKAKELIIYDELNLTEIAYKLGYKNVSHLSAQFKKITGLTPSFFKLLKDKRRNALDNL